MNITTMSELYSKQTTPLKYFLIKGARDNTENFKIKVKVNHDLIYIIWAYFHAYLFYLAHFFFCQSKKRRITAYIYIKTVNYWHILYALLN